MGDDSNRSKISKLLRFTTTKSDKDISLDKYLDRMAESQESIYYMAGESMDVMMKSPNLQVFKKKDLEVLMLTDHLDESCIQKLADYEGKMFVSIQKADVKIDETDEEKKSFSKRLTEAPLTVVTSQFGYSAHQEKVMKAQAFQNKDQIQMMSGRKTLEINPNHPVIHDLLLKVKEDKENQKAIDTATTLFQTAMIESGYEINDPSALVSRIYSLMSTELGVDPDAPVKEVEVPEDEDDADDDKDEEKDEKDDDEEKDDKDKEEL